MRTDTGAQQFSKWLLTIGRPQNQEQDEYQLSLPQHMCMMKDECVNFVYGGMNETNVDNFKTNALLTPWNIKADEINSQVLTLIMDCFIVHQSIQNHS